MKTFCILAFIEIKIICFCCTWSIDKICLAKKISNTFLRTITKIELHLKWNSQKTSLVKFHSCKISETGFFAKINLLKVVQNRTKQLNCLQGNNLRSNFKFEKSSSSKQIFFVFLYFLILLLVQV